MNIIKSFIFLFLSLFIGMVIKSFIPLAIPEMIYGMIILFIFLMLKFIKIDEIDQTASTLTGLFPLFLVPATVKILESFDILSKNFVKIFFILAVTLVLTMAATGLTVKFLQKIINKKEVR